MANFLVHLVGLFFCVACSVAFAQSSAGDGEHSSKPVKFWKDKHGNSWHYRTDHSGRLLTYKRMGSIAPEMQFSYDDVTGKPIAARLGSGTWMFKSASRMSERLMDGGCAGVGLNKGVLPAIYRPEIGTKLVRQLPKTSANVSSLRNAFNPGDDDDQLIAEAYAAYEDLQLMMAGLYAELQFEFENKRTPEEIARCQTLCNDVTDLAWIGCGSFAAIGLIGGPAGGAAAVALGLACMTYYYGEREKCRAGCIR